MEITLDFETYYGTKYSLTSLSYEQYVYNDQFRIHCCGFRRDLGTPYIVWGHNEVIEHLRELFPPGNENTLICHNALFDATLVRWVADAQPHRYADTRAFSKLLYPFESASLDAAAARVLKEKKGKDLIHFKNVVDIPLTDRATMERYCLKDVWLCRRLYDMLKMFIPPSELDLIDLTIKMYVERPLEVNRDVLHTFIAEETNRRKQLIKESGLPRSVLASTAQFGDWINAQGIDFPKIASPTQKDPDNMKYPLGKDSDEFADLRLAHPELDPVWKARLAVASSIDLTRAARLLSHSQVHEYNPHGRLGAPLLVYGAHTHRWSGTNRINLQNLRRGSALRSALQAPEGRVLVALDQRQIEARILAWLADERSLIEAYRNNEDTYASLATKLFGRPIDADNDPTERFVGKVCSLGLGYGMGPARLQRTLKIGAMGAAPIHLPLEQCQQYVNTFRTTYPSIAMLWRTADDVVRHMATADIHTPPMPWGPMQVFSCSIELPDKTLLQYPGLRYNMGDDEDRDPRFEYWSGKYWTRIYGGKLVENVVQALAKIVIADSVLFAATLPDTLLALLVHDEIVLSVPEERADEVYNAMTTQMRTPPDWANTDLVLDVEGGYARHYSK